MLDELTSSLLCSTIRLWSLLTGDCVHTLSGHDSFVYSLATIPDSLGGGLVSGGEDRTVRIWRAEDGECIQTIVVPAVSGASPATSPRRRRRPSSNAS